MNPSNIVHHVFYLFMKRSRIILIIWPISYVRILIMFFAPFLFLFQADCLTTTVVVQVTESIIEEAIQGRVLPADPAAEQDSLAGTSQATVQPPPAKKQCTLAYFLS